MDTLILTEIGFQSGAKKTYELDLRKKFVNGLERIEIVLDFVRFWEEKDQRLIVTLKNTIRA